LRNGEFTILNTSDVTDRVAGIDYGTVRIGIAMADLSVGIACPYDNYPRRGEAADTHYFQQLVQQENLTRFVIGLPVHLDGRESQKSREAREFGVWLGQISGLKIDYFDERYTSAEADSFMQEARLTKKQRKARRDQLAAQIMLTAYLESGANSQTDIQGLE
jgi:putative Holliday junction resolvase